MKIFSLLAALTLRTTFLATPVRADDMKAVQFAPQVRALLNDLLKTANAGSTDGATSAAPVTGPATPAAPATTQKIPPELLPQVMALLDELRKTASADSNDGVKPAAPSTTPIPRTAPAAEQSAPSSLLVTGLKTSTLGASHLAPSASLGGHGLTGGASRLSDGDWRQLFPVKNSQ